MSNLSDLLPAGGGAKVITATASGNLATGQTVVLNANGTVSEVSGQSESVGSEVVFETAQSYYCLLYTSPSPRDRTRSRMPSSA